MGERQHRYVPALGYRWLTPFYDCVLRVTTRETEFKKELVRQARIQSGHRVLDLGCGTGTLTVMAKRSCPEANVTGIDADRQVLRVAGQKVAKAGLNVQLDHGLATALPYGDYSFDRVLSSLLIHHLLPEDKRAAFHEVFRVLRPGGEFHVADWGRPQNFVMRLAFLGVQLLDGFRSTADHARGLLPSLISQVGFEHVRETACFATLFGTLRLYRARKGIHAEGNRADFLGGGRQ